MLHPWSGTSDAREVDLPLAFTTSTSRLVPAALQASNVGVWSWHVTEDIMRCDAACAAIFGVPPTVAKRGLPLEAAVRAIHPDDLGQFRRRIAHVVTHGGLFVAEYRTRPSPHEVRWVLARGRFEVEAGIGRGIVIDITDSKRDGHVEDRALFAQSTPAGEAAANTPLIRVCDRALDLKHEIEALGEEVPGLAPAVDLALLMLGRRLAQEVAQSEVEESNEPAPRPKRRRH